MSTVGQSIALSADGVSAAVFSGWPRKKSPTPQNDDDCELPVAGVEREPNMSVEQPASGATNAAR
jgi:hypothetical protein